MLLMGFNIAEEHEQESGAILSHECSSPYPIVGSGERNINAIARLKNNVRKDATFPRT